MLVLILLKPVYKLVGFNYCKGMIHVSKTVGAFDAKTHLSQYLQEVEAGACIEITRRGKRVAVLAPPDLLEEPKRNVESLIAAVRERGSGYATRDEINQWKKEGRR